MSDSQIITEPSTYSEKKKLWSQEYYRKNREKILKRNSEWWKTHPEQRRAKDRRRHVRCKAKRNEAARMRRLRNLDKRRLENREWQRKNWEYRRQYVKKYYQEHREKLVKRTRDWGIANPDRLVENSAKRRIREKLAVKKPELIRRFILGVKSKRFAVCYYCQQKVPTTGIHFDHIVPLVKGGEHSVENLCVACAHCNLSKHTSKIKEWPINGQQIMNL